MSHFEELCVSAVIGTELKVANDYGAQTQSQEQQKVSQLREENQRLIDAIKVVPSLILTEYFFIFHLFDCK
jgi:hypothetical protein